jgi:hypothetical protein
MRIFRALQLNLDVIADGVALVAAGQARVRRIERRLLFEPFEGRPLGHDILDACRIDILGDNVTKCSTVPFGTDQMRSASDLSVTSVA